MDKESSSKTATGYSKHSKSFWVVSYVIAAIVVYGLIYLLFIHKGSASGNGFNY